jgi:hypothetical protein
MPNAAPEIVGPCSKLRRLKSRLTNAISALFGIEHQAERLQIFNFLMYLHEEFQETHPLGWIKKT